MDEKILSEKAVLTFSNNKELSLEILKKLSPIYPVLLVPITKEDDDTINGLEEEIRTVSDDKLKACYKLFIDNKKESKELKEFLCFPVATEIKMDFSEVLYGYGLAIGAVFPYKKDVLFCSDTKKIKLEDLGVTPKQFSTIVDEAETEFPDLTKEEISSKLMDFLLSKKKADIQKSAFFIKYSIPKKTADQVIAIDYKEEGEKENYWFVPKELDLTKLTEQVNGPLKHFEQGFLEGNMLVFQRNLEISNKK